MHLGRFESHASTAICIVLVPRAPKMHSIRGSGVAAVQSSCSFVRCSCMRTETTRCGE